MICSTSVEEFYVSSDKAGQYTNGILSLTATYESDSTRLNALLNRLSDSLHISLFVMPAQPWTVPATVYAQYNAGFDQFFDTMVSDFSIRHMIYGKGAEYSFSQEDDRDVTVFLERASV